VSNSSLKFIEVGSAHCRIALRVAAVCVLLAAGAQAPGQAARWVQLRQQAVQFEGQGNYAAALPLEQQAVQAAQAAWGPQDLHLAVTLNALAIAEQNLEKFDEAEANFKQALAIFTKAQGEESSDGAMVLNNLATVYLDLGNGDKPGDHL